MQVPLLLLVMVVNVLVGFMGLSKDPNYRSAAEVLFGSEAIVCFFYLVHSLAAANGVTP